jgi:hypothetical protein
MRKLIMSPFDLDVLTSNLRLMNTIRSWLEQAPIDICRAFDLPADDAERLRSFTPDQLWSQIQAIGPISIVVLRSDFLDLLNAPTALSATLAAARPPEPASRSTRKASSSTAAPAA